VGNGQVGGSCRAWPAEEVAGAAARARRGGLTAVVARWSAGLRKRCLTSAASAARCGEKASDGLC
jgi:hypothetical protein